MISYDCLRLNYLFSNESNKKFAFQFQHSNQVKEMYTDDETLFKKIQSFLNFRCILSTFHEEYEVKKMIGKGSFAKVI